MNHLMPAYARQNVTFARGQGAKLWDTIGKEYLDALAGIAVVNLGHSHPKISAVIEKQCKTLMHVSNGFHIAEQEALAEQLCTLSKLDTAFFCNSGTEAIEAAIKICRIKGHQAGYQVPTIITMEKGFHGRTMGALSATSNTLVQKDMTPLLPGFVYAPFNDLSALKTLVDKTPEVVAILLEPIQGEGGIRPADDTYLRGVRALCDQKKIYLILDEIQTGLGRTGKLFAHEHAGVKPDIMTLAKALGNGYPIGVCLAGGEAAQMIQEGHHGTTFGGSPLACKIGSAVLQCLLEENLISHAASVGQHLFHQLKENLKNLDTVLEIRGRGLMIGIEMKKPCTALRPAGLKAGLVYSITSKNVIRIVPPLCLTYTQADQFAEKLIQVIQETDL